MGTGVEDSFAGSDDGQSPHDHPHEVGARDAGGREGLSADDAENAAARIQESAAGGEQGDGSADGGPSTGELIAGALDPVPENAANDRRGHGRETFA